MNEQEIRDYLFGAPVDCPIRVDKKIAKKWLLENKSVILGGTVFYFKIKDIGLGICEISKADLKFRETFLEKNRF